METQSKRPLKHHIKRWINEVLEAVISICIITYFGKREFDTTTIIKLSLLVGTLTFILETWNEDLKNNVKSGMLFTSGASILNGI